ncbi:MAG: precorrin-8X methylmutase, partial [Clostridia bacterium]|nr:precorrin-8X methylmutase [Clostridia bacterium]
MVMKPLEIEEQSMAIIESELQVSLPGEIKPIVKRVIHATADFSFAESLRFTPGAVPLMRGMLRAGAAVITDTNMALAGISKPALRKVNAAARCFMAEEDVIAEARARQTTRAAVSMERALALKGPKL